MSSTHDAINGGFAVVVGHLYHHGVAHSLPWLVAMTAVVMVDLFAGLRRCWLVGEEIRWSKGFRATISKLITYWAFALGAVCVQEACDDVYPIAMWACLSVIAIEGMSILGNILKPHGINLNVVQLIKSIGKKADIDMEKVVTKDRSKK